MKPVARIVICCGFCGKSMILPIYRSNKVYCSKRCQNLGNSRNMTGKRNADSRRWGGGKIINHFGYVKVYVGGQKYAMEHVVIAEKALGHGLPPNAEVHHVDEIKSNNANSNLVICQDRAYHKLIHARSRVVRHGGNPNTEKLCSHCRTIKPKEDFYRSSIEWDGCSATCKVCDGLRHRRLQPAGVGS